MKNIFFILFTLISICSFSQGNVTGNRVQANTNLLPPIDTFLAPYRVGELRTKVSGGDTAIFIAVSLSAPKKWKLYGSGGTSSFTNPMTNVGDIIVGTTSGAPTRLGIGTSGQVPKSNGSTIIWQNDNTGSATPGGTVGALQWNGSTGQFTGDTSKISVDSANTRIGIGTGAPTHTVTLDSARAASGISLYNTTDKVSQFRRFVLYTSTNISGLPAVVYAVERGGSATLGYHVFTIGGTTYFSVSNGSNVSSTHLWFGTDNSFDIGRLSASASRPRFAFIGTGVQAGTPVNIPITARFMAGSGTATAGTAPLKLGYFNPVLNTTPEKYAVEIDSIGASGGNMYYTSQTATRYTLAKTLTTTSSLDYTSVAAGATEVLTITLTGAADGDIATVGVPISSQTTGLIWQAYVSAANTVTISVTNTTGAPIEPATATFRVSVIKY